MKTGPHEPAAMKALGDYVRQRRERLADPTIRHVCQVSTLSTTKWNEIEHGRGPHSQATLRKVARGLGESPERIFQLAGIPYVPPDADLSPPAADDRLAQLEAKVARLTEIVSHLRVPADPRPGSPGT